MRFVAIALFAVGLSACNDNNNEAVVATGIAGNNFFASWQITSHAAGDGAITCVDAGADKVRIAVFKESTGVTLTTTFTCSVYQGLTDPQFETDSIYDVQMELLSPLAVALSTVPINHIHITIPGTIDLGLVTFVVP